MRYIAAYLLLQIGGNASPSAADIKKVLSAVGIEADDSRLDSLISELEGKSIDTLISEGSSKLASVRLLFSAVSQTLLICFMSCKVPSGGGAAASAPAAGGAAAPAAEKVEEKKEEEPVRPISIYTYNVR